EKTFTAVFDGALEKLLERHLSPALVHLDPRRNEAGPSDRIPAALRYGLLAGEGVRRPGRRRASGGVQAVQLLSIPDDGVGIGADAVGNGLDQRQRDRRGEDLVR